MKVVIVTGTRPDIIKMAPLFWEGKRRRHEIVLVHSMQHYPYHLFEGVYRDLELSFPPNYLIDHTILKRTGLVMSRFSHNASRLSPVNLTKFLEKLATNFAERKPNPSKTAARMKTEFSELFSNELKDADIVLTHGDTLTCMAASISAALNLIPVGHVEAGLRTFSKEPFPEQIDTRVADACSDIHFAATDVNMENLIKEGFTPEK